MYVVYILVLNDDDKKKEYMIVFYNFTDLWLLITTDMQIYDLERLQKLQFNQSELS